MRKSKIVALKLLAMVEEYGEQEVSLALKLLGKGELLPEGWGSAPIPKEKRGLPLLEAGQSDLHKIDTPPVRLTATPVPPLRGTKHRTFSWEEAFQAFDSGFSAITVARRLGCSYEQATNIHKVWLTQQHLRKEVEP